MKNLPAHL